MTARLTAWTPAEYHADPCEGKPSLSASIAGTLVRQSPFHAWLRHPKLGGVRGEATAELDRGTILHALVLGKGLDRLKLIDANNYRTKIAQEQRDAAYAAGMTPVLFHEMQSFEAVARAIKDELARRGIILHGASEQAVEWEEESSRGPVACRGMMDHVIINQFGATIYDLKTCRSAHPRACESHVMDYGYALQAAAYTSAVEKVFPHLAGRVEFVWLFAEEVPFNANRRVILTVAKAAGSLREYGRRQWAKAVEDWAGCLASGVWPDYSAGGVVELEAPAWALTEAV